MTLLTIIVDACNEIGISAPSAVIGNSDFTVIQMLALANRSGKTLAQRHAWQELTREATHTTVATESQGLVETIAPGFNWPVYESMWNRTAQNYVSGPLSPQDWQFLKAISVTGPYPDFRIRQKTLYMIPAPTAGQTVAFEYITRYFCQSPTGVAQERWADDADTGILNEDWLTLDLIWRWKAKKGLDYAEDFNEFERVINNAIARDGGNKILDMGDGNGTVGMRGACVPLGSWSV